MLETQARSSDRPANLQPGILITTGKAALYAEDAALHSRYNRLRNFERSSGAYSTFLQVTFKKGKAIID